MKHLLFLLLPFAANCQQGKMVMYSSKATLEPRIDTVRASLLLTRKKMTIAHNYEGHIVLNAGRVVEFLDDRKRRFKVPVIVWDYRLLTNDKH